MAKTKKVKTEREDQTICRLRDYVEYVDDRIAMDEMPLNYSTWQQTNKEKLKYREKCGEEPLSEGAKKAFVNTVTSFIHPGY